MPYVTLKTPIAATGPSGSVYQFTRPASDYAITDITNLWYSWAQYNVQQHANFPGRDPRGDDDDHDQRQGADLHEQRDPAHPGAEPAFPLFAGMTVTHPDLPAGTTIVKVTATPSSCSRIPTDIGPAGPGLHLRQAGRTAL